MGYGINETADVMGRMLQRLDHVSTNLANASTTGYKAEHLHASGQAALPATGEGEAVLPPVTVVIDYSRGLTQKSGNKLDLMLESDGFFAIQAKNGTAYTRKGDFTLNREGLLVTQLGEPVLGENGNPIKIQGQQISVGRDGTVKVDDAEIGRLKVVSFNDPGVLTRSENGYFISAVEPKKTDSPEVVQGALELSNVNMIREMVDMIDLQRSFEVYQKIIQTISEQDKIATNRVGRLV